MLLADLGGQRLKLARPDADGVVLLGERVWPDQPDERARAWLTARLDEVAGPIWLSSSRPAASAVLLTLPEAEGRWRTVGAAQVPLERDTTGTGSDRLLAGLAAHRRGEGACLVADLGTAWTLDRIDASGLFRGGAIGPGWRVQVEALAAACPHLDPPAEEDPDPWPRSTAAAVRAGTRTALVAAVRALADGWAAPNEAPPRRYLTGGDAAALRTDLGPSWEWRPHLVLEGLAWTARLLG